MLLICKLDYEIWIFRHYNQMKKHARRSMRVVFVLLILLLLPGCTAANDWERVDAEAFAQAIEDYPDGMLLDVRTTAEWEQDGHLENATLIPHDELEQREDELPEDKESLLLLYCRSGNRSQDAAQTLLDLGFTNIIELNSGIKGWKAANYSVVYP